MASTKWVPMNLSAPLTKALSSISILRQSSSICISAILFRMARLSAVIASGACQRIVSGEPGAVNARIPVFMPLVHLVPLVLACAVATGYLQASIHRLILSP